jgi:group II intron reverse transcriptase/maturase
MQSAETVLGVLCERGSCGLPCKELYRQLFNPQLYLMAHGNIYSNKGAMTPGADGETADGMALAKIGRIVDAMRHERYRFTPVKRVYIPKKNGKLRPLGLPSWSDKLVGEVIRLLLEAYYEPQFSGRSHGFRPGLGCHTALTEISVNWTGTAWFVEGDISDCFGSLDHEVMLSILAEKIQDNRFLRLIRNMLKAGYLEDWKWNATLSGVPQGGVVSPILSNIYLHKLDQFAEKTLAPEYTRGTTRAHSRAYRRIQARAASARARGDRAAARQWRRKQLEMPSVDPQDPGYRRLRYVRYADDVLLGFAGPKQEAEEIKKRLATFLHGELRLEMSQEKTLITHARSQRARFLGYEISTYHNDRKMTGKKRTVNGTIHLHVPATVIKAKCAPYLACGYPAPRHELVNDNDHTIVATFGAEYGGIVQYYLLAGDVYRLNRLHWVMQTALLRTLAVKHGSTLSKMARKYKATVGTPEGPRKCIEARIERTGRKSLVARFGGIPLRRQKKAVLKDRQPGRAVRPYKELTKRLLKGKCEICGQEDPGAGVHQVRKLADLARPGQSQPAWASLMARMRRKTLIVCAACHDAIHAGRQSTLA